MHDLGTTPDTVDLNRDLYGPVDRALDNAGFGIAFEEVKEVVQHIFNRLACMEPVTRQAVIEAVTKEALERCGS